MAGVGRAQMSDGPRGGCPSVGIRGVVCGALWSPWLTALRDERDPLKSDAGVREGPVSCALMSGLLRGICRWPSWVCACVLGANLWRVLEAHKLQRLCLKLLLSQPFPSRCSALAAG